MHATPASQTPIPQQQGALTLRTIWPQIASGVVFVATIIFAVCESQSHPSHLCPGRGLAIFAHPGLFVFFAKRLAQRNIVADLGRRHCADPLQRADHSELSSIQRDLRFCVCELRVGRIQPARHDDRHGRRLAVACRECCNLPAGDGRRHFNRRHESITVDASRHVCRVCVVCGRSHAASVAALQPHRSRLP